MDARKYNVLFLCTGNSARSILAESILRKDGAGRFEAFSAGSHPKGGVNPLAIRVLTALDYPTDGLRSKAWDEFAVPESPVMDFVFTVCDDAAGEACPVWPGRPMTAHWGIEDPAAIDGTDLERERAFSAAARYMRSRISAFIALPLSSLDRSTLSSQLRSIGRIAGATGLSIVPVPGTSAELHGALTAASLPTDDLTESGRKFFRFVRADKTVGFGGYELHDGNALLRSVVVDPPARGQGEGRAVTELLLQRAAAEGAEQAFLLTENSAPFFERLGFERIARETAPEAIRGTRQASSLCSTSAALMTRQLRGPAGNT